MDDDRKQVEMVSEVDMLGSLPSSVLSMVVDKGPFETIKAIRSVVRTQPFQGAQARFSGNEFLGFEN